VSISAVSIVPTKNPKVRDKGGSIPVGSSIERSGEVPSGYINRGVGALPREAAVLLQALDPVLASHRMRVRRRGVRSDDADRPLHEPRPPHPLLEAVFFGTAVCLCRAPSEFSTYGNKRSTP